MRIISPKSDICIKELFRNETVLKGFISDVLEIPLEEIRSVRLLNTFLWRRRRKQKLGILDILLEMNDDTKINIEMQLKAVERWDKRQIFYLAKAYVTDLLVGENYSRLRRCVAISILDFNITEGEEYHTVYRMRDKNGRDFSDMWEIHILELQKKLKGESPINDWIRFFNAGTEEDLNMIHTNNQGVLEAIREVKLMSLSRRMLATYEAYLKDIRDARAQKEYMEKEARRVGWEEGVREGEEQTRRIFKLHIQGKTIQEIADTCKVSEEKVKELLQ